MPPTRSRQIVVRVLAGIIVLLGVWAFARSPSRFLTSIGSSWFNRLGFPFLLAAFAAFALGGERLAYRILKRMTSLAQLPDRAAEKVLGRFVEMPPDPDGPARQPLARVASDSAGIVGADPKELAKANDVERPK